jgi:hypothetical protein
MDKKILLLDDVMPINLRNNIKNAARNRIWMFTLTSDYVFARDISDLRDYLILKWGYLARP